jgi:hypothetical protein
LKYQTKGNHLQAIENFKGSQWNFKLKKTSMKDLLQFECTNITLNLKGSPK